MQVDGIVREHGRIDGVVNNAIAGRQMGRLGDLQWSDYQTMLDFNLKAVLNVIRAARPHFQRQGGGRCVGCSLMSMCVDILRPLSSS